MVADDTGDLASAAFPIVAHRPVVRQQGHGNLQLPQPRIRHATAQADSTPVLFSKSIDARARKTSRLQFSDHVVGGGPAFFAEVDELGLEGIVSKRRDSRYRSGRTDRWRKIKCWTTSQLIVLGTAIDKRSGSRIAHV